MVPKIELPVPTKKAVDKTMKITNGYEGIEALIARVAISSISGKGLNNKRNICG
jgi:hypothetical protein